MDWVSMKNKPSWLFMIGSHFGVAFAPVPTRHAPINTAKETNGMVFMVGLEKIGDEPD
jgi:hypothetical protein